MQKKLTSTLFIVLMSMQITASNEESKATVPIIPNYILTEPITGSVIAQSLYGITGYRPHREIVTPTPKKNRSLKLTNNFIPSNKAYEAVVIPPRTLLGRVTQDNIGTFICWLGNNHESPGDIEAAKNIEEAKKIVANPSYKAPITRQGIIMNGVRSRTTGKYSLQNNNTNSFAIERIDIGNVLTTACKKNTFMYNQDIQIIADKFKNLPQGYDLTDIKNACSALVAYLDNDLTSLSYNSENVNYLSTDGAANNNLAGIDTSVSNNNTNDVQYIKGLVQAYYDKISNDGSDTETNNND